MHGLCENSQNIYNILSDNIILPRRVTDYQDILHLLILHDELEAFELVEKSNCSKRQCYYILKDLIKMNLIKKRKPFLDVRKSIYSLSISNFSRKKLQDLIYYEHGVKHNLH